MSGYILIQTIISLGILGGTAAVVATDWARQASLRSTLTSQTAVYAQINNAVGAYMTLYYLTLSDLGQVPSACEAVPFHAGASSAAVPPGCGGRLTYSNTDPGSGALATTTLSLANLVQPTVQELKALKLLDATVPEVPLIPVSTSIATGPTPEGSTQAPMENRYGIVIRRTPLADNINMDALVFNVQPYQIASEPLNHLARLANGNGGTSGTSDMGTGTHASNPDFDILAPGGAWRSRNPVRRTLTVKNPGGTTSSTEIGVEAIVAWHSGYDASASVQVMRRDGLLKPTADWSFGGRNLDHVGDVSAASLNISGGVSVGGTMQVAQTLSAIGGLVVSGLSDLRGALTVAGPATFGSFVQMNDSVSMAAGRSLTVGTGVNSTVVRDARIQTQNLATPGVRSTPDGTILGAAGGLGVDLASACVTANALAQQKATGKLLICQGGSWSVARFDPSIVIPPPPGAACSPAGALTLFPDATVAVCKGGVWTSATDPGVPAAACATPGAMASYQTSQGLNKLLVCVSGVWTEEIYAQPLAARITAGTGCSTDEINALAWNDASTKSGLLMCTRSASTSGASWQPPYATSLEDEIDYNEYLQTTFFWQGQADNDSIGGLHISTVAGTPCPYVNHYLNGTLIGSICTEASLKLDPTTGARVYAYLDFPLTNSPRFGTVMDRSNLTWGTPCQQGSSTGADGTPILGTTGCGNDWTNPLDPDTSGLHPGIVAGQSWAFTPTIAQYYWVSPGHFRINFFSPGPAWATYTVTMYRVHRRKYLVTQ